MIFSINHNKIVNWFSFFDVMYQIGACHTPAAAANSNHKLGEMSELFPQGPILLLGNCV